MGHFSFPFRSLCRALVSGAAVWLGLVPGVGVAMGSAQTSATPLILPGGLAYDVVGNLYFAETGRHVVRRLTPGGVLTVVAGTGVQGFAGDGGAAKAALLDSPAAVALDAAGDLFIADTHNRRIRRVDAVTGVITTVALARMPVALAFDPGGDLVFADAAAHQIVRVPQESGTQVVLAGSGVQGLSGDQGLALAAAIDSPYGLAFDGAGDLYFSDTHNHRVRRVDAGSGVISTAVPATQLDLPRGLTVDAVGNLYIVDAGNHRIRRVDGVTGEVTVVAGTGTEAFLGDGSAATAGALDGPRAVALSPAGLPTFADSGNNRLRQVDGVGNLSTIAGVGAITAAPAEVRTVTTLEQTSSQAMMAQVVASGTGTPTGTVTLLDANAAVGSATLSGTGVATFSTAALTTGSHTLVSSYAGSAGFLPSSSAPLVVTIGSAVAADFTLASSGSSAVTVLGGTPASFGFVVTPTGGALSSQVVLSVSGLPTGATASFSPGFLPPPNAASPFVLTISTPMTASRVEGIGSKSFVALAFVLLPLTFWRRRRRWAVVGGVFLLMGCGARVNTVGSSGSTAITYNLTVSATATSLSGATLFHTAQVTLTME